MLGLREDGKCNVGPYYMSYLNVIKAKAAKCQITLIISELTINKDADVLRNSTRWWEGIGKNFF